MSAFTKAMLILVLPTIFLSDCALSAHREFNREFDIFSAVKRAESIQRAFPNRNYRSNFPGRVQLCGDRLKETIRTLCRGQSATHQQSSTGSFSTGSRNTRYTRSAITDECCKKPCMMTSLLKYCRVAPQRPTNLIAPVPAQLTAKPNNTMNDVPTVKQLNMSEETETGRVLICFPKFILESTSSESVTDNLGNTWTKVIDSDNIELIEPGLELGETQNATLEAIEVPDPVVAEVVAEEESPAFGPETSEDYSMFVF